MNKNSMYRHLAIKSNQGKRLGGVVIAQPISYSFLTLVAVLCASIVVLFLILGTYTKRSTATGQLVPSKGLVKIFAPQKATVIERHVKEDQKLQVGDVLYILSSDQLSTIESVGNTASDSTLESEAFGKVRLDGRINSLVQELKMLHGQIAIQRQRVELADKSFKSYSILIKKGLITLEQLHIKQEDMLSQRSALHALERERVILNRQLSEQQIVLTAPIAGTATGVNYSVGQAVDSNKSMLTIVPQDSELKAELYVPSRAIGFIKIGDNVRLRYQAFPYQKFGHHQGVVDSVAKVALLENELGSIGIASNKNNEPLYRISVRLMSQTVNAYGLSQPLQAGMLLDADILQETRHLYEWVLEPLYSMTGKLTL